MVTFIIGKAGAGKTSVALGLAVVLLSQKNRVAYVTTDMSLTAVIKRIIKPFALGLIIYTEVHDSMFDRTDVDEWIIDGVYEPRVVAFVMSRSMPIRNIQVELL